MDWCSKLLPPVEPFTAPVEVVANFLASVRKLATASREESRTGGSRLLQIRGCSYEKYGAISNLIKGIGSLDPARKSRKPRYKPTWDMEPVLQALAKIQLSPSLPSGILATKTLALVAMATISRSSTLSIMSR